MVGPYDPVLPNLSEKKQREKWAPSEGRSPAEKADEECSVHDFRWLSMRMSENRKVRVLRARDGEQERMWSSNKWQACKCLDVENFKIASKRGETEIG